jgi:hypothetical protein
MLAIAGHKGRRRREPAQARHFPTSLAKPSSKRSFGAVTIGAEKISRMKGHEDGGNVLWTGGRVIRTVAEARERALAAMILRKEVIQPQVPLRLPCYDFTPVAKPTVVACLPYGLAQRLRVNPTPMV